MKTRKNILAVVALTIMMLCASAVNTEAAVSWPSISSSKVIKAYTISTGNNTTAYSDSSLTSKTGTVYASDELYISSIGKNNKGNWFCYVSYPTVFKRRYAYLPLSAVTGASSPEAQYTSRGSITAYRRSDLKKKAGTIYKGDSIYRLSTSGNSTQVLYNLGSAKNPTGWKMAWITTGSFNQYVGAGTGHNPEGHLDSAVNSSAGKLTVEGWALDRDALSASVSVHIYVGGPAGSGAPCYVINKADTYRPDVNNVYPGVGKYHGFSATINVPHIGVNPVYAYAINAGPGDNILIGAYNVNFAGHNPEGHIDSAESPSAGKLTVAGWALDRDVSSASIAIHVYVGGPAGSGAPGYNLGAASGYRPDVDRACPGVGTRHGFEKTFSVSRTGRQPVYVYGINEGPGENTLIGVLNVEIKGSSGNPSPSGSSVLDNPKVKEFINDARWRVGTYFGNDVTGKLAATRNMGWGCNAYARDFVYYVYGKEMHSGGRKYTDISGIRAGDVLYVTPMHWMVVLARNGNQLDIIHGNWTNHKVCRGTFTISGQQITAGSSRKTFSYGYHY